MSEKPKTNTVDKMSIEDLALVNKLVLACSTLYDRMANPPKEGPHTNPAEMDSLKNQVLLLAMRVGERVWYPRNNSQSKVSNAESYLKRKRRNKKRE